MSLLKRWGHQPLFSAPQLPHTFQGHQVTQNNKNYFWLKLKYTLSSSLSYDFTAIQKIIYLLCDSVYLTEGNGTPLQYSCLENPMDREAW